MRMTLYNCTHIEIRQSHKHKVVWKKQDTEEEIFCDFIYIKYKYKQT